MYGVSHGSMEKVFNLAITKKFAKKKMQSQLHFLFLPSESYRFFFEKHKKGKDKLNQNNLMLDYFL